MKKCPGCGTLTSDDRVKCGLCGRDLRGVGSFQGTVQDAARQIASERRVSDERFQKTDFNKRLKTWLTGILAGIGMIFIGLLLLAFGGGQSTINWVGYAFILSGFILASRAFFGIRSRRRYWTGLG